MFKKALLAVALLTIIALGPGGQAWPSRASAAVVAVPPQAHPAIFDKTRFVLHMGFAYFAFHHFVWARYKRGELNLSHKANLIKAGIAMLFAYHELKLAYNIANGSHSRTLRAIVAPLNALLFQAQVLGNRLKGGQLNSSDLGTFNSAAGLLQGQAGRGGYAFQDRGVPVPGA